MNISSDKTREYHQNSERYQECKEVLIITTLTNICHHKFATQLSEDFNQGYN